MKSKTYKLIHISGKNFGYYMRHEYIQQGVDLITTIDKTKAKKFYDDYAEEMCDELKDILSVYKCIRVSIIEFKNKEEEMK